MNPNLFWPLGAGALALLFVVYLTLGLLKKSRGNDRMIEISIAIQEGAKAFLKREYFYVAIFVVVIGTFITIAGEMNKNTSMGWPTALAFVFGAICSALTGYIGMSIATRANCRTTQAAAEGGTPAALGVAISGGAVMGMSVVGISVIGLVLVYYFASYLVSDPKEAMSITNGFAMGASLMALFARSGGGI
ncbi:sodium/proton-translocating pyrophosphatase, partial [bacterium]|nr:sodium/proton-translocating pyrophosphatase [bacterium]